MGGNLSFRTDKVYTDKRFRVSFYNFITGCLIYTVDDQPPYKESDRDRNVYH